MPKKFLFFLISLILLTFFFAVKETQAYEEKDPVPNCVLTPTTASAPGITDYIFNNEEFDLIAQYTDLTADHKFRQSSLPYTVTISYGKDPKTNLPFENILGDMKLIRSVPNNDEKDLSKEDTQECIERNHDYGDCTKAEDLDPGDQIDSWTMQAINKLKFNQLPGLVSLNLYEKFDSSKTPISLNNLVCTKELKIVDKNTITVSVIQPLNLGDKVDISGTVQDHLRNVKGASVNITIGNRTVKTATDDNGAYRYNQDDTATWNLTIPNSSFEVKVSTVLNGETIRASGNFGLALTGPLTSGQLNIGTAQKVQITRYFNPTTGDHWTSSQLQIPNPSTSYQQEEAQGELYVEDDGSGPLVPIYDCINGTNHYTSLFSDSKCNANGFDNRLGYIYNPQLNPRPTGTHPLYLCKKVDSSGAILDEKTSLSIDCKDKSSDITPYSLETTLGFALDSSISCPKVPKGEEVKADVGKDQTFTTKVEKVNVYPGITSQNENNPNVADTPQVGVNYDNYISKILGDILSQLKCAVSKGTGLGNFCGQNLVLASGTNLLKNKVDSLHGSYVYNIQRSPVPFNAKALYDDPQDHCQYGNAVVSDLTNKLGNEASIYTVEFPKTLVPGPNATPIPLKAGADPAKTLNYGTTPLESERIGQYDKNRCLYQQGTFYPGVPIPDLPCNEVVAPANPTQQNF
ncbi:hypothetical protein HY025_02760 [Candidatus Daviesbacteria bacterium]|nr:hypothetical protein [Candidatus Daviesbacteria bacterium]